MQTHIQHTEENVQKTKTKYLCTSTKCLRTRSIFHRSKQQRHRPSCTCAWLICALSFAIIETLTVTFLSDMVMHRVLVPA